MTCFDLKELAELVGGFVVVVGPVAVAALIAFGWAVAILAGQFMRRACPCTCRACDVRPARRAGRRRRAGRTSPANPKEES